MAKDCKGNKLKKQGRIRNVGKAGDTISVVIFRNQKGEFAKPCGRDTANTRKKKTQKARRDQARRKKGR